MNSDREPFIRIVCPCYNEAAGIAHFFSKLDSVLQSCHGFRFEIAFIDDGSRDETLQVLNRIRSQHHHVVVYALSRNFGHQAALLAGIDTCADEIDALIMMDSDLQHPPENIPLMLQAWRSGTEVVSMVRRPQETQAVLKRLTSWAFYRLMQRMTDLSIVPAAADFGLIGRDALTTLRNMRERDLFLRGALSWIGFSRRLLEFDVAPRLYGESKYTFRKMLSLAKAGIFTFSTTPIRLTFRLGLTFTGLASLYLLYAIAMYAGDGTVRGWTSMIAVIVFFGGLNLFTLGVLGEYIARTFEEVKQRPRYIFKQSPELESTGRIRDGRETTIRAS